jgi:hypothetical protein
MSPHVANGAQGVGPAGYEDLSLEAVPSYRDFLQESQSGRLVWDLEDDRYFALLQTAFPQQLLVVPPCPHPLHREGRNHETLVLGLDFLSKDSQHISPPVSPVGYEYLQLYPGNACHHIDDGAICLSRRFNDFFLEVEEHFRQGPHPSRRYQGPPI